MVYLGDPLRTVMENLSVSTAHALKPPDDPLSFNCFFEMYILSSFLTIKNIALFLVNPQGKPLHSWFKGATQSLGQYQTPHIPGLLYSGNGHSQAVGLQLVFSIFSYMVIHLSTTEKKRL